MSLQGRIATLEAKAPSRQRWLCIVGVAIPEDELRRRLRADGVPEDAELDILSMEEVRRRLKEDGYNVDAEPGQEGHVVAYPCPPTASGNVPVEAILKAMALWRQGT